VHPHEKKGVRDNWGREREKNRTRSRSKEPFVLKTGVKKRNEKKKNRKIEGRG